jgi:hypothetical protein
MEINRHSAGTHTHIKTKISYLLDYSLDTYAIIHTELSKFQCVPNKVMMMPVIVIYIHKPKTKAMMLDIHTFSVRIDFRTHLYPQDSKFLCDIHNLRYYASGGGIATVKEQLTLLPTGRLLTPLCRRMSMKLVHRWHNIILCATFPTNRPRYYNIIFGM